MGKEEKFKDEKVEKWKGFPKIDQRLWFNIKNLTSFYGASAWAFPLYKPSGSRASCGT